MKPKWFFLLVLMVGLVVAASPSFGAAPTIVTSPTSTTLNPDNLTATNGEISWYLAGTWDNRFTPAIDLTRKTIIQLVNPGPNPLWAFVTLWNAEEAPLACYPLQLSRQDFNEVGVSAAGDDAVDTDFNAGVPGQVITANTGNVGAVKVLSTNSSGQAEIGLVGYRVSVHAVSVDVPNPADTAIATVQVRTREVRLVPQPLAVSTEDTGGDPDALGDELQKIANLCNAP